MRLALITGGSRGLGQALTNQLESSGYHVVEFSRSGSHARSVHVDLSEPEQSREVFRNALAGIEAAHLDELIVINNAGTLDPIGPAWRKPNEAVLQNLNTNFVSGIVFITEAIARFQAAKRAEGHRKHFLRCGVEGPRGVDSVLRIQGRFGKLCSRAGA